MPPRQHLPAAHLPRRLGWVGTSGVWGLLGSCLALLGALNRTGVTLKEAGSCHSQPCRLDGLTTHPHRERPHIRAAQPI